MKHLKNASVIAGLISIFLIMPTTSYSEETGAGSEPLKTSTLGAQKVDLGKAQQKYGSTPDSEVQIVQNRAYTKVRKFELGAMGGVTMADVFLNTSSFGGYLGFHFSEYFGLRGFYWKDSSKKTAAWDKVGQQSGLYVNTNAPTSMMGGEFKFTPMYGKLAWLGSRILYFDLSVFAGAGTRKTESGSAFSPILGIGQQVYFTKSLALGIDYRLMKYKENIIDTQAGSATLGQVVDSRSDISSILFLSLSWLFGF